MIGSDVTLTFDWVDIVGVMIGVIIYQVAKALWKRYR